MQDLLKPDWGVLALTLVNFGLLVFLLKKFAWGPIIGALEKREQQIASDKQTAQQAREEAAQLKADLENQLARIASDASAQIAAAVKMGENQKEQLLAQAKEQADRLLEQAKAQIEAEKNKALQDVRGEIAQLSILAASRVVKEQVSASAAQHAVEDVLNELRK